MALHLETYGCDPFNQRRLHFLIADDFKDLTPIMDLPEQNYICLLIWDAHKNSDQEIYKVGESILLSGAKYVCSWGSGCERVHVLIDLVSVDNEINNPNDRNSDAVIMTTSHEDESLEEALYFFLACTWPDEEYIEANKAGIVICVGNSVYPQVIRKALQDPEEFRSQLDD